MRTLRDALRAEWPLALILAAAVLASPIIAAAFPDEPTEARP